MPSSTISIPVYYKTFPNNPSTGDMFVIDGAIYVYTNSTGWQIMYDWNNDEIYLPIHDGIYELDPK